LVQEGATIEASIIRGADFYELDERRRAAVRGGLVPAGVGAGASIKRAIIDKNARIGAGAVIHGAPGRPDEDHRDWCVRDGIVIVAKNATIPPGAVL
jgi:glucose-1-phosphate adenylyltransferase